MFTWIQKHQQTLLIVILVIVVIAFVWLYNPINDPRQLQREQAGQIYGRPVGNDQFVSYGRMMPVAYTLNLFDLVSTLAGPGLMSRSRFDQSQAERQFVWNLIVLREEARRLGLDPTAEQLREKIMSLPAFQTEAGQYSEGLRAEFVENQLGPRGFNWAQAEQIIADSIRLEKLQNLLGATAVVDPVQARQFYEFLNRQTLVQVARMDTPQLVGEIEVSDEEIEAYYAGNKAGFLSEPKVVLDYVRFPLPQPEEPEPTADETEADADADAEEGEETEAEAEDAEPEVDREKLQAVIDKAQKFASALFEANQSFHTVAEELGLEVQTTEQFEVGQPPEVLSSIKQVSRAISDLNEDSPNSNVLQSEEAYYVLHLKEMASPQQLPVEDVRDQIVEILEAEKREEKTIQRSAELKNQLQEALAAGTDFAEAAEELGFQVSSLDPFTMNEPPQNVANLGIIMQTAARVPAEKISDWQSAPGGGLFVYVAQREGAPEEQWDTERGRIVSQLESSLQQRMTQNWFESRLAQADFRPTVGAQN